jgi:hypothetical protein
MSMIIWCDSHGGPFSENQTGWALNIMHIRLANGSTEQRQRHTCAACTEKLLMASDTPLMLEASPADDLLDGRPWPRPGNFAVASGKRKEWRVSQANPNLDFVLLQDGAGDTMWVTVLEFSNDWTWS